MVNPEDLVDLAEKADAAEQYWLASVLHATLSVYYLRNNALQQKFALDVLKVITDMVHDLGLLEE